MTEFVDTNVFVHFLLGFDEPKHRACRDLLKRAEDGLADLETSVMVIAELVWFLGRPPVRMTPPEIRDLLRPLLGMGGLRLADGAIVLGALDLYASGGVNFIDACIAENMARRGINRIYSYDRDFESVTGITRLEPQPA